MTPYEVPRFQVYALNRHGVEVDMRVVEREGRLILWDGLASHRLLLSGPNAWTAAAVTAEIERLTGATRVTLA